jgi:hypothetical protein
MFLYIPTTTTSKGSAKKTYPAQGEQIFCRFRTFGGTETTVNGVLVVENTATIETWYRPDIKSDCILKDVSGLSYEILGTPEDIEQRHQFLRFKVRAIKGGV